MVRAYIEDHGSAVASELAAVLGLGTERTRAVLREMTKRGIVVKLGDKRYTRYILPGD